MLMETFADEAVPGKRLVGHVPLHGILEESDLSVCYKRNNDKPPLRA